MSKQVTATTKVASCAALLVVSFLPAGSLETFAQTPAKGSAAQAEKPAMRAQSASSYEAVLTGLAGKLVVQLESANQKSGTVIDFTDLQGQGTELGRFLAQELSDQLVSASKSLSLVDRANLQHLLRENKLSMEGLINPESGRKLGHMIGIDTIIFGTVTPIGPSVRLSVRAVAVETGRIVASQSATVPAIGDLGQMYTRGVQTASAAPASENVDPSAPRLADVRDRLRADSFKLTPLELVAHANTANGSLISYSIENRSGIGVGIAVRADATTAGPCDVLHNEVRGLAVISQQQIQQLMQTPEPAKQMRWLPPNGKVSVSMSLDAWTCPARVVGLASVPLTVNLVVAAGKDVLVMPLNADKMPVRVVRGQ